MAYSQYNVTSVADILDVVLDFANAIGWQATRGGTQNAYVYLRPPGSSEDVFYYTDLSGSSRSTSFAWAGATSAVGFNIPASRMDFRVRTGSIDDLEKYGKGGPPTLVHAIGRASGTPFMLFAIESSPGLYQHMYFGYTEKIGGYSGGEVVSTTVVGSNTSADSPYEHSHLLASIPSNATNYTYPPDQRGGVRINGVWYKFRRSTSLHVAGGAFDHPNAYAQRNASNSFSGYTPLSPVNLWLGSTSSSSGFWQPIGPAAGVRFANMENFFPTQLVELPDGTNWRVFPATRISNWSTGMSSGPYAGYAFCVDD